MTAHAAVLREAAGGGAARKGGTLAEGSPFDPLLRFFVVSTIRRKCLS